MSHRTNAEGSIAAARDVLAELVGQRVPTDTAIANAARAQAIATSAVAQALLALDDTITAATATGEPTR